MIYLNYFIIWVVLILLWIDYKSALKLYKEHKNLLIGSFMTFCLMAFWFVGSGFFIWLATRVGQ